MVPTRHRPRPPHHNRWVTGRGEETRQDPSGTGIVVVVTASIERGSKGRSTISSDTHTTLVRVAEELPTCSRPPRRTSRSTSRGQSKGVVSS